MATKTSTGMEIPQIVIAKMSVLLVGDSPLIVHAWSEKAKRQMLDKQMKQAKPGKAAKDPEQDFQDALYRILDEDGATEAYGFPSTAFKAAAVTACTSIEGVTKVAARQAFHILGELARTPMAFRPAGEEAVRTMRLDLARILTGDGSGPHMDPQMREDNVRVGMGTADLRYRPEFWPWSVRLTVRWNATTLSVAQILNLLNTAGFGVGIGEWRPERDGTHGTFHVESHEILET